MTVMGILRIAIRKKLYSAEEKGNPTYLAD